MERNYSRSTMDLVGDLKCGLRVDTPVSTCLLKLTAASHTPFNIYGRVKILHLFIEAITAWGAQAGTLLFNYISTSPVINVRPLSGASAVVTSLAQGLRVVYIGGAVASLPVITATAGVSDVICEKPQIVGIKGGYGTIGYQNSGDAVTSGTMQVTICYAPMSEGSYIETAWN
jgi:hypothetical protein